MSMNYMLIVNLLRNIMDYLTEGAYEQIEDILSRPELGNEIRGVLRQYVTLITIKNQQIESHMNDFIFFKGVIKKINKGVDVTVEDVMNQNNINQEKLEVAAGLISRIEEIKEESKIFAQSKILEEQKMGAKGHQRMADLQMENIKMQSLLNILQDEAREEKEELIRKIEVLEVEREKKEDEVRAVQGQLVVLSKEVESLKQQVGQKLSAMALLKDQIQRLSQENHEKADEIVMTNENIQQLIKQIQSLNLRLAEKEQSLEVASQKADELTAQLEQQHQNLGYLREENEELKHRLDKQEEQLRKLRKQVKQYQFNNENSSQILLEKQEIIKQQDLSISNLKSEIEQIGKQKPKGKGWSNISEILLSDQDNILLFFAKFVNSNQFLAEALFRRIQAQIGNIQKVQLLYKYSSHKHLKFHTLIDKKPGILLMCLTEDDRLIGGFTTAAFSLELEPKNTRAFLFTSLENELNDFKLKPNKRSLEYDMDYIIFGNEELCIEMNKLELTSFAVGGPTNRLHYEISVDERATFLVKDSKSKSVNKIALKDYQIVQVTF